MNFISHFYLDRNLDNSLFFVGVSTPDLVSVFDRNVRLKKNRLPLIMENESSEDEISFYNGLLRHFEVDRIFHTSDFFYSETARITKLLQETFPADELSRTFFVAHVLFELVLDKILIQQDPNLLTSFYSHFDSRSISTFVQLTEWATHTPMPRYDDFLQKFLKKKYLYNYTDWRHVTYILKRIMQGVGISKVDYLLDERFISMAEAYEEELTGRMPSAFAWLNDQLYTV